MMTEALYLYSWPPPLPPPPPLPVPPWRDDDVALKSSYWIRFGETRVVPYTSGIVPPCCEVWNCSEPTAFCCLAFDTPPMIPPIINHSETDRRTALGGQPAETGSHQHRRPPHRA